MSENNLDIALRLAGAGLAVFPVAAEGKKRPLIRDWDTNSTTDPDRIRAWWRIRRGALASIDLRKAGLVVIDADRHGGPDGVEAWRRLVGEHGFDMAVHPVTRTPNAGLHVYFSQPVGEPLRCRPGGLQPGIECKGAGGSIIAPGNVKADGTFYEPASGHIELIESYAAGSIPRSRIGWPRSFATGSTCRPRSRSRSRRTSAPSASSLTPAPPWPAKPMMSPPHPKVVAITVSTPPPTASVASPHGVG